MTRTDGLYVLRWRDSRVFERGGTATPKLYLLPDALRVARRQNARGWVSDRLEVLPVTLNLGAPVSLD